MERKQDGDGHLADIPIWDIWVRLFHWGLLAAVAASFATDQIGDLESHYIAGLIVLGLLVFRILWGFVGSPTARFANFLRGPGAALVYLKHAWRRTPSYSFGHNPAGAIMVVVLLFVLLAQAVSGLFNTDDILFEGPLYDNASSAVTDFMADWHGAAGNAILALIGIHVVTVLLYRLLKRENLARAMITGQARLPRATSPAGEPGGAALFASPLRGLVCVLIASAVPVAIHWLS